MGASKHVIARMLAEQSDDSGPIEQVRVRILPDGRMTREEAAKYIGLTPKTLAMWALADKGPRPVKIGGRIFYYRSECDRFIRGEAA